MSSKMIIIIIKYISKHLSASSGNDITLPHLSHHFPFSKILQYQFQILETYNAHGKEQRSTTPSVGERV